MAAGYEAVYEQIVGASADQAHSDAVVRHDIVGAQSVTDALPLTHHVGVVPEPPSIW
jgi:hypothetical protein